MYGLKKKNNQRCISTEPVHLGEICLVFSFQLYRAPYYLSIKEYCQ